MQVLKLSPAQITANIKKMNEVECLQETEYETIKDFYNQYKVIDESHAFKERIISEESNFNKLRSQHPFRHDVINYITQ